MTFTAPKQHHFLIPAVLFLGVLASGATYLATKGAEDTKIVDRARIIAASISVADIEALSGNETDLAHPSYLRVKEYLTRIETANSDIRFVYVLGKDDDHNVFFYVDSEDLSSPDYSPPGQIYYEATPLLKDALTYGTAGREGPTQDRWGVWISAFAPLTLSSGVALVGLDLPATQYLLPIVLFSLLPLILSLTLVLGFIVMRISARE